MPSIASLLFCASLSLDFVAIQAQSGSGGLVVSSDGKKREELRWFPADNVSDCDAEPGLEQVREGRPSLACREDEERFCLCGRVGRNGTTNWRFGSDLNLLVSHISPSSRFLCGTCNISFKLDRRKGSKVDGKKKELASRTLISVPAKKGL